MLFHVTAQTPESQALPAHHCGPPAAVSDVGDHGRAVEGVNKRALTPPATPTSVPRRRLSAVHALASGLPLLARLPHAGGRAGVEVELVRGAEVRVAGGRSAARALAVELAAQLELGHETYSRATTENSSRPAYEARARWQWSTKPLPSVDEPPASSVTYHRPLSGTRTPKGHLSRPPLPGRVLPFRRRRRGCSARSSRRWCDRSSPAALRDRRACDPCC